MNAHRHALVSSALVIALAVAGCGRDVTLPATAPEAAIAAEGDMGTKFNPQPEPPAL